METDHHQILETASEQVGDDLNQAGSSPARSYECTFCKRGFSTAQALGGHMNIHRKDKAKLKKASNNIEAQNSSLDISKPAPPLFSQPIATNAKDPSQAMYTTHQERSKIQWPNWINVSREDHDHTTIRADQTLEGEPHKISFLRDHMRSNTTQDIGSHKPEKCLSSGHGSSSGAELDLELRLGPEPHGPSKTTGTKKF